MNNEYCLHYCLAYENIMGGVPKLSVRSLYGISTYSNSSLLYHNVDRY